MSLVGLCSISHCLLTAQQRMSDPNCIVFLVDDDPLVRDSVADLLDSAGFPVRTFGSATEFVQSERPDLSGMPDSRRGIARSQRPRPSGRTDEHRGVEMPIIFLTGHGDIPMSVRAMKAGAVEFLTKPFRKQELLDAVQEALRRDSEDRKQRSETSELRNGSEPSLHASIKSWRSLLPAS